MTVAEQVISVFTEQSYLDDVDLDKIKKFEKDIIEKIKVITKSLNHTVF